MHRREGPIRHMHFGHSGRREVRAHSNEQHEEDTERLPDPL